MCDAVRSGRDAPILATTTNYGNKIAKNTRAFIEKMHHALQCVKQCHKNDKIQLKRNDIYAFPLPLEMT